MALRDWAGPQGLVFRWDQSRWKPRQPHKSCGPNECRTGKQDISVQRQRFMCYLPSLSPVRCECVNEHAKDRECVKCTRWYMGTISNFFKKWARTKSTKLYMTRTQTGHTRTQAGLKDECLQSALVGLNSQDTSSSWNIVGRVRVWVSQCFGRTWSLVVLSKIDEWMHEWAKKKKKRLIWSRPRGSSYKFHFWGWMTGASKIENVLGIRYSTLATWHEQPIHWKRPWCWERLKAKREGEAEDEMVR